MARLVKRRPHGVQGESWRQGPGCVKLLFLTSAVTGRAALAELVRRAAAVREHSRHTESGRTLHLGFALLGLSTQLQITTKNRLSVRGSSALFKAFTDRCSVACWQTLMQFQIISLFSHTPT